MKQYMRIFGILIVAAGLFLTSCESGSGSSGNSMLSGLLALITPNGGGHSITAYSFTSAQNPGLSADVSGTISGTSIAVTVPYGTMVTSLKATFATTGASVTVGSAAQTSGVTANDFTNPVTYTVTAADGSTQDYTVTVTIAVNTAKEITAFGFTSANNSVLSTDVTGAISGTNISVTVPYGTTSVTALVATFTTTGTSVKIGTTVQTSGTTVNDFLSAKTYTVTAADGSTQSYTVTVTVASASAKAITAFSFTSAKNSVLSADVTGTISGTNIAVTVPYGTTVTGLVATFATTGASVKVGTTVQTSGITANDFSLAKTYTVTAADSSSQDYTITVTIAADSTKAITGFGFTAAKNTGLAYDVMGTITGTSINITVPYGTDVTALIATYSYTGSYNGVYIGSIQTMSGIYSYNFTNPVIYTVYGEDDSTQDFTVTVTVASNSSKEITSFSFPTVPLVNIDSYFGNVYGAAINGTSIIVTLPYPPSGSTSLPATFTANGTVTVGGVTQESGVTLNDFANPVTYRVTAADGSWKDYTVTVIFAPGIAINNGASDLATYWTTYTSTTTDADSVILGMNCNAFNADSHTYNLYLQTTNGGYVNLEARAAAQGGTVTTTADCRVIYISAPSLTVMKKVLAVVEYRPPAYADEVEFWVYLTDTTNGLKARGKLTITVNTPSE